MLSQRVDVSNMQDFIKGDATVIPQQLGFVNFSAGQELHLRNHPVDRAPVTHQALAVLCVCGAWCFSCAVCRHLTAVFEHACAT